MRTRPLALVLWTIFVLCGTTAPAWAAADTWIGSTMVKVEGSPLEVGVGENASLHANLDGSGDADVFWFDEAGLTLALFEAGGVRAYGTNAVEGDELRLVSLPAASGSGTDADPWTITSTWDAGSPARLRVSQVVRFTQGSQRFTVSYAVQNVTSAPLQFRPYVSADIAGGFAVPIARLGATDPASAGLAVPLDGGVRDPNDPPFDGLDFGKSIDIEPVGPVPYRHAVAGEGPAARLAMSQGDPLPSSLPPRTRYQPMMAADWDAHAPGHTALAPGATFSFGARFRLASYLRTLPLITGASPARPHTMQIRADLGDTGVLAGRRLAWAIYGYTRNLFGTMTTDSAGAASLTWTADGEMNDRVVVWIDTDGDGAWDRESETTRQSRVDWAAGDGTDSGTPSSPPPGDTPGTGVNGSDVTASGGGVTAVTFNGAGTPDPGAGAPARASLRVSPLVLQRMKPRVLRASGRTSRAISGRVALRLTDLKGAVLARATAPVRARRFAANLRLRRPLRGSRAILVVRYAGDAKTAPLVLRRRLVIRR